MYTLYGAEVSYFSGKVRAYLRWRGAPFREVAATQEIYSDLILPHIGWPVIPVLAMPDGRLVQDSAEIISAIEEEEGRLPPVMPGTPLQDLVCALLHLYADEWLTIPAMHYRWSYDADWAYAEFGALSLPGASPEEQYAAGKRNGQRFRGALPVLGIHPATIPGIEKSYSDLLHDFSAHLEVHPFLLGGRATLADFAFIGPFYAHLYRDPFAGQMMRHAAPLVADWVERMSAGSRASAGLPEDDCPAPGIEPILRRQAREQFPFLLDTIRLFSGWAAMADAGAPLPRGLGETEVRIEGCTGPAQARSFSLYRLQAVTDIYDMMCPADRLRADALFSRISAPPPETFRLPFRLARRNHRLVLS